MFKGTVTGRVDSKGNSFVRPDSEGNPIILSGSDKLLLPRGTRVEYEVFSSRAHVNFAKSFFCLDAVFHDNETYDTLVIGRRNDIDAKAYFVLRERIRAVTGSSCTISGVIEETAPRVDYFTFLHRGEGDRGLASALGFSGVVVDGVFRGANCKSLLSVPHRPDPARDELAKLLSLYIKTRTSPYHATVVPTYL